MKVAVTGASGFFGSHVLRELASRNEVEVIAVTRRSLITADLARRVQHVQLDINAAEPHCFARLGSPDILIHLAWETLSNYRSLLHFQTHLVHHFRFLESMIRGGLADLLCVGTCFEYGMRCGELTEDLPPQPQNPYGYAKNALRQQLEFLRRDIPFRFTWARPFYVYGEGQSANALYPLVMAAGRRGDAHFPMSGGEQLRDYLPIAELARYLVSLALQAPDSGIINVCSGRPIAVRTLVEDWISQNGWTMSPQLGRYPYPDYEPMAFWGSKIKLSTLLGLSS